MKLNIPALKASFEIFFGYYSTIQITVQHKDLDFFDFRCTCETSLFCQKIRLQFGTLTLNLHQPTMVGILEFFSKNYDSFLFLSKIHVFWEGKKIDKTFRLIGLQLQK